MRGFVRNLTGRMIVGVSEAELTEDEESLFREYPPAGVILFPRNVTGKEQLRKLTSDIESVIVSSSGLKPFLCADHEGGRISVLAGALGVPPSQMALGRCLDPTLCRDVFTATARLARSAGINTLLSPVADVNSNRENPVIGTRSFGETPELAGKFTAIAVDAVASEGVISCAKHFPGHGASSADSHMTLPLIPRSDGELEDFELVPFREAVSAGVPMVMVGHIAFGERLIPASMDGSIIGGWLRGRLGFNGVVLTDALEMEGAFRLTGGFRGGSVPSGDNPELFMTQLIAAISSGNDIL